jgi:hypothetical protein
MPFIPYPIRNRHIYIVGGTQRGKSTLMRRMFYQDVKKGAGCAFFDPKGTHIDKILHWIPENRIQDCIHLDLDHPVPIDLLSYSSERTKQALIKDLIYIVAKNTGAEHAPVMHMVLNNVINAILDANDNPEFPKHRRASFLDITRFLENESRQKEILKYVRTPLFREPWPPHAPPLLRREIQPTITRMTEWKNNPILGRIMGNPNPDECLNLADLVNNRKVLLVNLGGSGTDRFDWAALLLAKIQQAAFSRYNIPEHARIPFFCYLDEFQNFKATENIDQMLSMAGELKLCLTLANQYLHQVTDLFPAIIGNVSSYILFQLSHDDAMKFRHLLPEDDAARERKRNQLQDTIWQLESHFQALQGLPQSPSKSNRIENNRIQLRVKQEALHRVSSAPSITVSDITGLRPHWALYKIGDDFPSINQTPPPAPLPTPEQLRKAEMIKKRTIQKYSCNTAQEGFNKGDGDSNTTDKHDDAIKPSRQPKSVPPHGS